MRVAVVGLGVSGSLYALLAAGQGLEVVGFDFPGRYRRPCGEAVPSPELVSRAYSDRSEVGSVWASLFNSFVAMHVVDRLRRVGLFYAGSRGVELVRVDEPGYTVGYIIDKASMIEWLRGEAEAQGARLVWEPVRPGRRLEGFQRIVYACGGCAQYALRRKVRYKALVARLYCSRVRLLEEHGVDAAIVFVRGLPGYVWAWRAGDHYNTGVGALERMGYTPEELLGLHSILGASGCGGPGWSRIYWFAPVNPAEPVAENGLVSLYALGEAAGMVTAMAEGIRPSLMSAYALAMGDTMLGRRLASFASTGRALIGKLKLLLSNERIARMILSRAKLEYSVRPPTLSRLYG